MSELTENLNSFQHRSPKLYLGFVVLLAVLGIGLLLLFPLLSIKFLISAISTVFNINSFTDLAALLYQLPLAGLFGYLSYQFVMLPLDTPKSSEIYISLNRKKTPKLITLIEELQPLFNIETINSILLTDKYEISMHYTPEYCLPKSGQVTLQIGLPVMQTISAKQFKALLGRRMGQFSLVSNPLTGRIVIFADLLKQYTHACKQNQHWSYKPFYFLLKSYTSLFDAVSFYAIRMDELASDTYAIDIIDRKAYSQTLSQRILANTFLKNTYWLTMYKLQRQYPNKAIFPHANMAVSFTQSLSNESSTKILDENFQRLSDFQSTTPLLRARLKALGFEECHLPNTLDTTAAIVYLDSALPKVTRIFDKLWIQRIHEQQEPAAEPDSNKQRLNNLTEKIQQQALSAEETWELAVLTEKIKGYHAAIPIYKKILERNPAHAKAMFAIGRILLSYNDATGIDALNKAVIMDANMKKTAEELIARYQSRQKQMSEQATSQNAKQNDELFA